MQRILAFLPAIALLAGAGGVVAAPSVGDVLSANKAVTAGKAWDGKATVEQTYAYSGQGLKGTVKSLTDLNGNGYVDRIDLGTYKAVQGYDGKVTWSQEPSGTVTVQEGGDGIQLATNESYRRGNMWWRDDRGGATITVAEKADGGMSYDVLTVTPKGGKPFDAWFNAKTHELARIVETQGGVKTTTALSDYKAFEGVKFAQKTHVSTGGDKKYDQDLALTASKFLPRQDASAYVAPKVTVSDYSIANGAKETTFPFELINNHIYAKVMVNGKGPYTFIFDTGGANLVTPTTAKALGLEIKGSFEARGAGEGTMEAGFTNVDQLRIGDAVIEKQHFYVLPLDALTHVEGIDMPGMVGFETFRRFVTRIDYGNKTITLIDAKLFNPKDAGTAIPFKFNQSIPEIEGKFEGIPATFDIDTGARSELTLTKPYAEKHEVVAKHPKSIEAVEGWGVGGPSRGIVMRASSIMLGGVEIKGVVTTATTQEKGAFAGNEYSGNIGGGILKRFVVTFDYENKVMYLKPIAGTLSDVGTFDRAGMWINVEDSGFKVVDVTKASAAEKAGMKADDVITAVNGKPASGIKLADLRRMLRNEAPGTKITFAVTRGKETLTIPVTLQDQI